MYNQSQEPAENPNCSLTPPTEFELSIVGDVSANMAVFEGKVSKRCPAVIIMLKS